MSKYININSQLDALKVKEIEEIFYNNIDEDVNVVPKVTPFKGINTDMLYIEDNKILFIKFMDTSEDLFFILEEELLEVMNEEFELLKLKMAQINRNISYNYIFIMPYVDISEDYGFVDFVSKNIVDRSKLKKIIDNKELLKDYLKENNSDIDLNLFMLDICPEYYLLNDKLHLNKHFKKISFSNDDYQYTAAMLDKEQIKDVVSVKYGNTLFTGGSGSSKTTIMLSRAIKLARLYPHHKFLIFTYTKQLCTELREKIDVLYKGNNNLEVHTFSTFIFKLAKKYNLVIDYSLIKNDYEKAFNNLIKQARNIIKNKHMFKGIFIDECESFSKDEVEFIREFLYKSKFIFNVFNCNTLNIYNNLNIFKDTLSDIDFDDVVNLESNYRQSEELTQFVNNFGSRSNDYIKSLRENKVNNTFLETKAIREGNNAVNIIKVSDLDEQIKSVIWEIQYLINKKGLNYSEIAIIYPFNKKKLKSGKTIYFQYLLKKALEEAQIPFIYAEDNLTNLSKKIGVTISNIYTIKNLEYKAAVVCELEMLYNHTINDIEQDYQINDFVGDLNKVYLAITRATDYMSIITAFNEEASNIIKLLMESK